MEFKPHSETVVNNFILCKLNKMKIKIIKGKTNCQQLMVAYWV